MMKSVLEDIVACLLWLGLMVFIIWLFGWSISLWWYLGWG